MRARAGATARWVPLSKAEAKKAGAGRKRGSRKIILKWDGECSRCFGRIAKGSEAYYSPERGKVRHIGHCKRVATSKGA